MAYKVIVDDDVTQQKLLAIYLGRLDAPLCLVANNGQEALALILKNYDNIDLVFTDKNMPVMDGIELVKEMRKHRLLNHIQVVMMSSELTSEPNPFQAEINLRQQLKDLQVLPLPKSDLSTAVLGNILKQLTHY